MSARPQLSEPIPQAPVEESAPVATHGWNAYEVWRDRVLKKNPAPASDPTTK
jgi:hypothetical protein